mgnify:CR=1 FL=1
MYLEESFVIKPSPLPSPKRGKFVTTLIPIYKFCPHPSHLSIGRNVELEKFYPSWYDFLHKERYVIVNIFIRRGKNGLYFRKQI